MITGQVIGSRFTDKYLQSRYTSSYARTTAYPHLPVVPPRSSPATSALLSAVVPPTSPSSPPRKVISEFKAFASAATSMADTPLSSGGTTSMDELTNSIEMKFGAISLDQVSF